MKPTIVFLLTACSAFCFCSCNKASLKKIGISNSPDTHDTEVSQSKQIERLKVEVAELEGRVKQLPENRTDEIQALQAEAAGQAEELQKFEAAISKLQARKSEIENEFNSYKRQYVTR